MPVSAPVHVPAGWQSPAERSKAYDQTKARPYNNRRWQHLRNAYLATHPICECEDNCGGVATVVDHRRPHLGDDALMYAWDNLRSMTKPCHDRKTATRDGGFGNPVRRTAL